MTAIRNNCLKSDVERTVKHIENSGAGRGTYAGSLYGSKK